MRQNRKTRCQICGDVSKGVYYTATSCKSCMDFFRRCVIYKKQYKVNIYQRVEINFGWDFIPRLLERKFKKMAHRRRTATKKPLSKIKAAVIKNNFVQNGHYTKSRLFYDVDE